jgi:FlaA1/EpsC-like NDP-sugar epimerase
LLGKVISEHQIEQLLISTPRISEERLAEIVRECEARNIELKRMSIRIESIADSRLPLRARSASNSDL